MPNYCSYEMKIKGSKSAIERVLNCLKADYNYKEGKPAHKHFFRVFSVNEYEGVIEKNSDNTYTKQVWGDCAWSVYCCMCKGGATYYDEFKKDLGENFMGTNLYEQSQDCEIEVFSEEEGNGFSEHYIFENGECWLEESERIQTEYTDDEDIIINPNRENNTGNFLWEI